MKRVYLDHSATTPVRPEVAQLVQEYLTDRFGNPSSVHAFGREAKQGLDKARNQVAKAINATVEEIIFTSGGTESDNLAISGAAGAYARKGKHIVTSAIEHHAVLDTCRNLEKLGYTLTVLPVDSDGLVQLAEVERVLTPDTILVSIMHANNEIGTIQPIEEIGRFLRQRGIIFHVDAVQSLGKIPVDVEKLQVDLLSGSGHKIYGPKGSGFLYVRKGVRLQPLSYGGGQERTSRPGTENLPGIAGLGLALELAQAEMAAEMKRLAQLRDRLISGLTSQIPHVRLNGHPNRRVPTNANLTFEFVEGESLLLSLDLKGIAASSGSACTSGSLDPSHVLTGMGLSHELAHGSIRLTLGRGNSEEDIDYVLEVFPPIVERLRAMSPLYKEKDNQVKDSCSCSHLATLNERKE